MKRVLFLLSLATQMGYMIALPAVGFGFGGAYLDRLWGTSPLFVLTGFGIAIALSALWVYHFIKEYQKTIT